MRENEELFKKLISGLVEIFNDEGMRIVLYGSVARGTQTEESDIDIAVIIPSYTKEMRQQMISLTADLDLEYDRLISVVIINTERYNEWVDVLPFYKNINTEGILLWPAA